MKNFVKFYAEGVIYKRDSNGNPVGVKDTREGTGITREGSGLYGYIFRQCTQLLPCDRVTVKTYKI